MEYGELSSMNRFLQYNSITLNGTLLHGDQAVDHCHKSNDLFLKEVGNFLKNWFHHDPYIQLQTSGSTGVPKIILVHKDQMLVSAGATAAYFNFQTGDNALLCLPVKYIAGKMMIVRALFSKLNLICINPSQNPVRHLPVDTIIDFAAMIPMQLKEGIELPSIKNIKKILLGGGPMDAELVEKCQFIRAQIYHGYAMTETLSHIALRKVNGEKASEFYTALPGIELQKDKRGCLVINAPGLLNEALITNDIVEFIGTNQFIWKGRYDNVINSGGIKLIPENIELKMQAFLNRRFILTGMEDAFLGEKMILIIEGESFNNKESALLEEEMKLKLGKYEIPKQVFFVKQFIETKSGKINRPQTRFVVLKEYDE